MSIPCHRRCNRFLHVSSGSAHLKYSRNAFQLFFAVFSANDWTSGQSQARTRTAATGCHADWNAPENAYWSLLIELLTLHQTLIPQSSYVLEYSIRTLIWNHDSDTWMTQNHWSSEWLASAFQLFWVANTWRNPTGSWPFFSSHKVQRATGDFYRSWWSRPCWCNGGP